MTKKNNVHDVPRSEGWGVLKEGNQKASKIYETKRDAERAGRETVKKDQVELGIHNKNGKISDKNGFSSDQSQSKGSSKGNGDFVVVTGAKRTSQSIELSPQEKAEQWREWAAGHSKQSPILSDEDISRSSIYGDRG